MATNTCPTCGGELPHPGAPCPECGDRPRTRSPYPWAPAGDRRSAVLYGLAVVLLILAALIWVLADSRRTPLETPAPIPVDPGGNPGGG